MKPHDYPVDPAHLWEHFYQITQIPRPSKQEEAVRHYVTEQAEALAYTWQQDSEGNIVVYVPARNTAVTDPVIIQNHLDMVTVKTEDKSHDFTTDALHLQVNDGWLQADRTTLGADNGVGVAAALAVMTDPTITTCPPLELLFTVDEETGLGGALNLDAQMLSGTRMLNLDTEDWNELYIGCAGGAGWEFRRGYEEHAVEADSETWSLALRGLAGGHSGVQIHEQLGNAIKLLAHFLQGVPGLRIVSFESGVAHNVIPREASVEFSCAAGSEVNLRERMQSLLAQWLGYLPKADSGISLQLVRAAAQSALSTEDSSSLLDMIALMPHGAQAYSFEQPADLVDLSINLAVFRLDRGVLFCEASYRFFNQQQSEPLQQTVAAWARAYGLEVTIDNGYPGWEPDFDSPLLAQGRALHTEMFGFDPAVKAIHAGLECGILKSKKTDVDILSFGPTIRGAHSPTERLDIDTVAPFWRFLTELLARM